LSRKRDWTVQCRNGNSSSFSHFTLLANKHVENEAVIAKKVPGTRDACHKLAQQTADP
jgi:hypothetical protein